MMEQKITRFLFLGALFSIILLLIGIINPLPASALPPRPDTPTPTPVSTVPAGSSRSAGNDAPVGGWIVLLLQPDWIGAESVVQWQDNAGNWHAVEGWRNQSTGIEVRWWVAQKDFGTGPFRWLVYQSTAENTPVISQPFYLPQLANQITEVVTR